jgi:hypothetical protein
LAGKKVSGLGIHQVPDPEVVLLFAFLLDKDGCFVAVPDVTGLNLIPLGVFTELCQILANPPEDSCLIDCHILKLRKVIGNLPKRDALEIEIKVLLT